MPTLPLHLCRAVERSNLLNMMKISIKGLIDCSMRGRTLNDDHPQLQQFLVLMELILKHRIKSTLSAVIVIAAKWSYSYARHCIAEHATTLLRCKGDEVETCVILVTLCEYRCVCNYCTHSAHSAAQMWSSSCDTSRVVCLCGCPERQLVHGWVNGGR